MQLLWAIQHGPKSEKVKINLTNFLDIIQTLGSDMGASGSSYVEGDYQYYCEDFYQDGAYYQDYQDLNYDGEGTF